MEQWSKETLREFFTLLQLPEHRAKDQETWQYALFFFMITEFFVFHLTFHSSRRSLAVMLKHSPSAVHGLFQRSSTHFLLPPPLWFALSLCQRSFLMSISFLLISLVTKIFYPSLESLLRYSSPLLVLATLLSFSFPSPIHFHCFILISAGDAYQGTADDSTGSNYSPPPPFSLIISPETSLV